MNDLEMAVETFNKSLLALKGLQVQMPDGSQWVVPVRVIALNRAKAYEDEFGDVDTSMIEDTLPLFESSEYEIKDWAANNMNWADVVGDAIKVAQEEEMVDYEEGWVNGEKQIVEFK